MYADWGFIHEGMILKINDYPKNASGRRFITYTVRVNKEDTTNGYIDCPGVRAATMFGGIADYIQTRHRASQTDGGAERATRIFNQEAENAKIGDHVYIAFIGGNQSRPVIVGFAQHPDQIDEFPDDPVSDYKPQTVFQHLGFRIVVDEDGQVTLIHKGAPKIVDTGAGGAAGAALAAAGGALAALSGATPENPALGDLAASDAVTEPETTEITLLEFLKAGVFRIRDAEGQMIEIDRTKKRIYISNNDLTSLEDPTKPPASGGNQISSNSTDAEYVLLDKDKEMILINTRKLLELYSFDRFKQVTEGDSSTHTKGDTKIKLDGDEDTAIDGSRTVKIDGDWSVTVKGDITIKTDGDATIDAKGDVTAKSGGDVDIEAKGNAAIKAGGTISGAASGGAAFKVGQGKVGLGASTAEVVDLLSQTLDQLSQSLGNLGFPLSNAAAFAALKILADGIKGGI